MKYMLRSNMENRSEGNDQNRYNYPTPRIRDIKGKETQTQNNLTLMETSLAESQTELLSH